MERSVCSAARSLSLSVVVAVGVTCVDGEALGGFLVVRHEKGCKKSRTRGKNPVSKFFIRCRGGMNWRPHFGVAF